MKKLQLSIITALFLFVQLNTHAQCPLPTTPTSVMTSGGLNKVCPGETRTYTTSLFAGVTYNWTAPTGGDIISGQGTNSITITYNSAFTAPGILSVVKVNACGNSPVRSTTIPRNMPSTPSLITGSFTGMCGVTGTTYSVFPVADIVFNWIVPPGVTITSGQGTNTITADYPNNMLVNSYLSVTANNACGTSMTRKMMAKSAPGTPATIYGSTDACPNSIGNPYSIDPVTAATYYVWTGPKYSILSDGITTSANNIFTTTATAVTVDFGNVTTGNKLSVKAYNGCNYGMAKSIILNSTCGSRLAATDYASLSFYPNPADNEFTIYGLQVVVGDNVKIFDAIGKQIFSEELITSNFKIKTTEFKNGVYFVQINNAGNTVTKKLLVKH